MFNLLSIELPNWVATVLSLFAVGGIGFYLVQRVVERKKFKKDLDYQESTINKSNAEVEKVKAEAYETNTKANAVVVKIATEMAERLSKECDITKQELKEKDTALEKTQQDLNSVRYSLKQAIDKIDTLQLALDQERKMNIEMVEKNTKMAVQIFNLTEQIKKLKGE